MKCLEFSGAVRPICALLGFKRLGLFYDNVTKPKHVVDEQDRQYTHKSNTEERSGNHRCRRKTISITCSQPFSVAVIIQHAVRMSRIVWLFVVCLNLPYFSTYLIKGTNFGKVIELNFFLFYLQIMSETFHILRRTERDTVISV